LEASLPELTQKILNFLKENQIPFKEFNHQACTTCEEFAEIRGTPLEWGAKTALVKDKQDFRIFVLAANQRLNSNRVRKILKSQWMRFAYPEELKECANVTKGALPPVSHPFLPYDLYMDEDLLKNEQIVFTIGIHTKSILLKMEDYRKLVQIKEIAQFSK